MYNVKPLEYTTAQLANVTMKILPVLTLIYFPSTLAFVPWTLPISSFKLWKPSKSSIFYAEHELTLQPDKIDLFQEEKQKERPTETMSETEGLLEATGKPKILVLGATGNIGRLVVEKLMAQLEDATIVACVRNRTKAEKIFLHSNGQQKVCTGKRVPKLVILEGDLVTSDDLPDTEEVVVDGDWLATAESNPLYYEGIDEDNSKLAPSNVYDEIQESMKDCTAVISCVGNVRPTKLWDDVLRVPFFRLLRADVSKWCSDPRHPYYVNHVSTRKVLKMAEKEQRRRDAERKERKAQRIGKKALEEEKGQRIRFIRISHFGVGQRPWTVNSLITNIFHSLVFRYHDMTEAILDASSEVDTFVFRPGKLINEKRDPETTSLQVCPSGTVPSPCFVGRDDVADMAVTSLTFQHAATKSKTSAFHHTLGMRWASEDLVRFPPQGRKCDGESSTYKGLARALGDTKKFPRKQKLLKPFGIYTALATYALLFCFLRAFARAAYPYISRYQAATPHLTSFSALFRNPLASNIMSWLCPSPNFVPF